MFCTNGQNSIKSTGRGQKGRGGEGKGKEREGEREGKGGEGRGRWEGIGPPFRNPTYATDHSSHLWLLQQYLNIAQHKL